MKLNHINEIQANISIYTRKKTSNLLDGTYHSVYKGKSMNFENLREYGINDDVKDIDWKSSTRSGTLLVKQFIAEKKHNIMIVIDTGMKMDADTEKLENKKDIALNMAGAIGYIAIKNGDYVGLSYNVKDKIVLKSFKDNLYNLEEYLCCYESDYINDHNSNMNSLLKYLYENFNKKMIIFVISDLAGLDSIDSSTLKQISNVHDIMAININDNLMTGKNVYDVDSKKYIAHLFLNDDNIKKLEQEVKKDLLNRNIKKFKHNKSNLISISSISETSQKIIKLLEEHRYASNH